MQPPHTSACQPDSRQVHVEFTLGMARVARSKRCLKHFHTRVSRCGGASCWCSSSLYPASRSQQKRRKSSPRRVQEASVPMVMERRRQLVAKEDGNKKTASRSIFRFRYVPIRAAVCYGCYACSTLTTQLELHKQIIQHMPLAGKRGPRRDRPPAPPVCLRVSESRESEEDLVLYGAVVYSMCRTSSAASPRWQMPDARSWHPRPCPRA